jgi:hypothetical protein
LIRDNKTSDFSEDSQGTLWLGKRICVPNLKPIKELILREAHDSAYCIHPSSTKMYKDLKTRYWWYSMKRDVTEYVALCDTCQRVKAEHQRQARLLQPLKILEWKWKEIGMDFIVGLPRTQAAYHPQTDGQTERTNQILKDMLRACALKYGKSWDKSLPYAEFSYNNSYQVSIKMGPFEALYGRQCRTSLF